jgi:ribonuclease Z
MEGCAMLDICLLGTSGMMPLPNRWLTSMMARYNGSSILVDCGEGTQIAIKEKGWTFKPIDVICFTHYHADHISGLPGLLLTMGNADREEPLLLVGPAGLERVVEALRVIAPELPFEINYRELHEQVEKFQVGGMEITAFRVNHNIVCYGYTMEIQRVGKFQVEKAKELGIPLIAWNRLQKNEQVEIEGELYTPQMVLGPPRKGLKVTYCTDTRPTKQIVQEAKESDLLIIEGMYGEPEKAAKARKYKHMTFYEAAEIAREAQVKEMWLTHFSPSLVRPESYMKDVQDIFSKAQLGKDGKTIELVFED